MRNILLAVVGLSPQVLTETLYALHQEGRRVDEIHVITTRVGKERIYADLLSPHDGMYRRYLHDYGIPESSIAFGFDHVHVVRDARGIELDDIRDEDDNALLMKTCAELSYRFTLDPGNAVFFSIAGGRKTMSACLTAAAHFYGRLQDRIYHVLVTSEFENNRDFFYPPPVSRPVELFDGKGKPYTRETRYAEVSLISIPFVSLRDRLSDEMLNEPKDPATLMLSLIREKPAVLEVDMHAGCLRYKGREADIHPSRLAVYAFFVREKRSCTLDNGCRSCFRCYLSLTEILDRAGQIMELYRTMAGTRELASMSDTGIMSLDAQNFNSYKSKLKRDIIYAFGLSASHELIIESRGKKPDTRFGIRMPRERLRLIM